MNVHGLHNLLFSSIDWSSFETRQREALFNEIAGLNGDRILNTSADDLCEYLSSKYCIDVPVLLKEEIEVDQSEAQIDVSRDQNRYISDRSTPFLVKGTAVEATVPFSGDASCFGIRPTSYTLSPPVAAFKGSTVVIRIEGTDLKAESVRLEIDRTISEIDRYLTNLQANAGSWNQQLHNLARKSVGSRRAKLLADRNLVGALGYKMRERRGSEKTYVAPEIQRKLTPVLPKASVEPYQPEPILSDNDYEHILSVIQNMAHVMERSPSAFIGMDEESLRSHFLVQLNGHYEGQATGETFNYQGKTDILIRVNGKNVFIAECKFWSGQKMLIETIDQVLSYSSWRDTKIAVIVFNRNKDFTKVVESIENSMSKHSAMKRALNRRSETVFQYVFSNPDDRNREMVMSVLAFNIPT